MPVSRGLLADNAWNLVSRPLQGRGAFCHIVLCHLLGCGQLRPHMHSVRLVSHAVSRVRENTMPAVVPVEAWLARYNRPKH